MYCIVSSQSSPPVIPKRCSSLTELPKKFDDRQFIVDSSTLQKKSITATNHQQNPPLLYHDCEPQINQKVAYVHMDSVAKKYRMSPPPLLRNSVASSVPTSIAESPVYDCLDFPSSMSVMDSLIEELLDQSEYYS